MAKARFEPETYSMAVQRFNHWATTSLNVVNDFGLVQYKKESNKKNNLNERGVPIKVCKMTVNAIMYTNKMI